MGSCYILLMHHMPHAMCVRHNKDGEFTSILPEDVPIIEKHLVPINPQVLIDYDESEERL